MLAESTTGLFPAFATIWSNSSSESSCRTSSVSWFVSPLFRKRSWKKLLRLPMFPSRPCSHLLPLLVSTLVLFHPHRPIVALVFIVHHTVGQCLARGWLWCSLLPFVSSTRRTTPLFRGFVFALFDDRGVSSPSWRLQPRTKTTKRGSGPSRPSSITLPRRRIDASSTDPNTWKYEGIGSSHQCCTSSRKVHGWTARKR